MASRFLVAEVTDYGTIITELHVPDRQGKLGDIVLGFDNLAQYLKGHPYFGCTVGRVATALRGRIHPRRPDLQARYQQPHQPSARGPQRLRQSRVAGKAIPGEKIRRVGA
jgi:hypothetical protein